MFEKIAHDTVNQMTEVLNGLAPAPGARPAYPPKRSATLTIVL